MLKSKAEVFGIYVIVWFLSIWGLILRFKHLDERELWGDELFQLQHSLGPFKPFWQRLTYGDLSSFPGDYLLTFPFLRWVGTDKWSLALPHIAAAILGFYLLYRLCRRYYRTPAGYIVAFVILAYHGSLIFHSFEFRPYGVLTTLSLATLLILEKLIGQYQQLTQTKRLFFYILLLLIFWFHPFGLLMFGTTLFYILLRERGKGQWRCWKGPGIQQGLIFLCVALPVWLWYASGNPFSESPGSRIAAGMGVFDFVQNPYAYGFGKFFNRVFLYNLIDCKRLYFLLGGLALGIIVPSDRKLEKLGFFLVMIFLPIMAILTAAVRNHYWFLERQYVFVVPLFAFWLGWLWDGTVAYYRDCRRAKVPMVSSWRTGIGLICLIGCPLGGIIGILSSL